MPKIDYNEKIKEMKEEDFKAKMPTYSLVDLHKSIIATKEILDTIINWQEHNVVGRELALTKTKLDEARFWAEEAYTLSDRLKPNEKGTEKTTIK